MEQNRKESQKFTCYFCNKTIENETATGHTAVCGNVLVPCPNKCGSYIRRLDLRKHDRECVNRTMKSPPRFFKSNEYALIDGPNVTQVTSSLGRNGMTKTDSRVQEEIHKLSRKLSDLEIHVAKSQVTNQTYETLKNNLMQQNLDLEKLKYQSKLSFDWKNNTEIALNNIKQSLSSIQHSKRETDSNVAGLQNRLGILERMLDQVNYLKDSFFREQAFNRQVDANFEQNINDVKSHFSQENALTLAILNDVKDTTETFREEISKLKNGLDEHTAKFTNIIFDLRAASQIASEALEKLEIHERECQEMKKELNQLKLDVEILEGLSCSNELTSRPGRLLWKVTDVETKMMKAKEFGSVAKSPIFYSHDYDYRIRVLMYMNGLKKWKDRYALLCIHVLKGEYDMLLRWPCHIEGTITIRDLKDLDKPKPFSKYINAKRHAGDEESEEPQESSSSYIFIPHSTLLKSGHLQEDTLFIDVKIQQNGKQETSL
nr:TNF receptor-associated factor 5 [Leptinotarsa decemlineata]